MHPVAHGRGRRRWGCLTIVGAVVAAAPAWAQGPSDRVLTPGPPLPAVYAFAQTADGALWLGGQQGLSRFDGTRTTTFDGNVIKGLTTTQAFHLQVDRQGRIWLGTGWGLPSLFDGPPSTGGLRGGPGLFRNVGGRWDNTTLPTASVQALFAEPGTDKLWIATDAGLWKWEPDKLTRVKAAAESQWITSLVANERELWVGGTRGLFLSDASASTEAKVLLTGAVTKLLRATEGGVWAGTNDGLFHVSAEGRSRVIGLPDEHIRDLTFDRAGHLWVATLGGVCEAVQANWSCWTEAHGLPDPRVLSLFVDRDDVVWLGTRAAGTVKLTPKRVHNVRRNNGLNGYVAQAICPRKAGGMWVATDESLSLHDGSSVQTVLRWTTPPQWISLAEDAKGTLWVGRADGSVFRVVGMQPHAVAFDKMPAKGIRTLLPDKAHELWIGWTAGGISKATYTSDGQLTVTDTPPGVCPGNVMGGTTMSDGTRWFTMDQGGISQWQNGRFRCLSPRPQDPTRRRLSTLVADANNDVWIGSINDDGLYLYHQGKFFHADEADGMACDSLFALLDHGDELWTACGTGVQRLRKAELLERLLKGGPLLRPLRFDVSAGMASQETTWMGGPTAAFDAAGKLWVATLLGISIIDTRAPLPLPPLPKIESLLINGVVDTKDVPQVRASHFTVTASLTTASLAAEGRLYHRYRVREAGIDWRAATGATVTLPSLRPGLYTLEVMAANGFGVWSTSVDKRRFVLLRPLYQNPWMIGAVLACAGGLAWVWRRARQARRNERVRLLRQERDRMSRDLHDGMGQGFSSIGFHLEAIEESLTQAPQDLAPVRGLLKRTREIVDRAQASARQAVWDLRDLQDQTPDLAAAIRSMVRTQMMGRKSPQVSVNVGKMEGKRDLFAEQELALLAKEALTNALRHAQAHTISIDLERDSDFVHLAIKDDGVGMKNPEQSLASEGHFGILGMNERIRRLGGTINIVSSPGHGTEIAVTVPNNKPKTDSHTHD